MRTLLTTTTTIAIMHVFNINTIFNITTNSTKIKLNNDIMIHKSQMNVSIIKIVIKKKSLL